MMSSLDKLRIHSLARMPILLIGAISIVAVTDASSAYATSSILPLPGWGTIGATDPWIAPVGKRIEGANLSDGWTDLSEVPSPISVDGGWTDSVAIMPSGRVMYFGYSKTDFAKFFDSGYMVRDPIGPPRPGLESDAFKIFRAELTASGWSVNYSPINSNLKNTDGSDVDEASASPNAAEDIVVFSRFNQQGLGTLFYSLKNLKKWSEPVALPTSPAINTPNSSCLNDNPFVVGTVADGLTLYFESNRIDIGGLSCRADGKKRLYMVDYSASGFGEVQLVPGLDGGLPDEDDTQIALTPDKSKVYFTRVTSSSYGVYTADFEKGKYTNVRKIISPNLAPPFANKVLLIGEANIVEVPQGKLLYMICGIPTGETGGKPTGVQMKVCRAKKHNSLIRNLSPVLPLRR